MRRLGVLLATVGGVGYVPFAPGTLGSAVGLAIYLLTRGWSATGHVALLAAISLAGVWAAGEAAAYFQVKDPGRVVVDEVAGQLLTLLLLDVGLVGVGIAFLLFRLFDIVKPWPARQFEQLPGGVGIMADDLMAGVYGWVVMRTLIWLMPASL
ncbi:MAG: phosphatidylglycerophosphatase A [Vicinamibacterales bacterium]